jgi:hypothetical protein
MMMTIMLMMLAVATTDDAALMRSCATGPRVFLGAGTHYTMGDCFNVVTELLFVRTTQNSNM